MELFPPKKEGIYGMPTEARFGRAAFESLPGILSGEGKKKIVFITAPHFRGSARFSAVVSEVRKIAEVTVYEENIRASDFRTINAVAEFVRKENADSVVAIGGGTILDTGKCAAGIFSGGNIEEYVREKTKKLSAKGVFFVAVPTTAGTGSEVTPWATVWGSDMKKYSLSSPEFLFPDFALIDPSLTDSLPAKETAITGADALTQAIEAYWNVNNNLVSDEYALQAIPMLFQNLPSAVNDPTPDVRDSMMKGSFLSGLAFSNTQTTLCHAVSYPLSAHWGVPHGQAVAVMLPLFFEYILPAVSAERRKNLFSAIGAESEKDARGKLEKLLLAAGLKIRLSDLGIPREGIQLIVEEGYHPDRAKNSPRIPEVAELAGMLESIF